MMADPEIADFHRSMNVSEKSPLKSYPSKIPIVANRNTNGSTSPSHKIAKTAIEPTTPTSKLDNIFRAYNNGNGIVQDDSENNITSKEKENILLDQTGMGESDTPVNSVAVATKIGKIIQNLGIAESNSDIPSWAKSLIMALGEATTELQYISTDQTEKTKELQTTITDQSIKINQLEERCHIQEFLMKILQEEKDLLNERITNFEAQMKKHKKEKKMFVEKAEEVEARHQMEKREYVERIEQLETVFEQHASEKTLLLDKIDSFEVTLKNNKDEKQRLLEKIDQCESALDDAMVYIRKNCLLNRDTQQPLGSDGKLLDKNADKEAVRNFIHNMLHKDKLSKLI